jgi:membrane protease YdiL (CAAX protease family)
VAPRPVKTDASSPSRAALAIELVLVAGVAAAYLSLLSERPRYWDLLLAAAAVTAIALDSRRSRRLWAAVGGRAPEPLRPASGPWSGVVVFTGLAVLALGAASAVLEYVMVGRLPADRFGNWHVVPAILLYLPWAWLQQFVFQFYLLGRLLHLLPAAAALTLTALAFAAVHYPRYPIMALTAMAGAVWALSYRRHRRLAPLAVSHAVLGPVMLYWLLGRDLLGDWLR